ncbi:MAG TPA: YncE family protein [Verrucomicrobiae bacterium]|jgi:DNA-binding beta-propeller fold protein YncE|nr:YncE family protein [Verrucomicrobiae bacterium]
MKLVKIGGTIGCLTPVLLLALSSSAQPSPAGANENGPYHVSQIFQIGGEGGWDYLTVDPEHHLLYVPRSTHTMVIDAATGKTVADMPGQKRNHGVALVPSAGRGFITDGSDGSVTVFDLKTYAVLGKVKTDDDSDGVIYDPASGKVLVVCGDPGLLIPISPDIDLKTGKMDAPVDLGGKPEFLAADGQGKAYINLVDKNEVAVVDTRTMKVVDKWSTAPGGSPVGMSMDTVRRRLYIGCRRPQKLVVMDADNGKVLADFPIGAGVDATKFDGEDFASCGDGTVTVVGETSPGKFEVIQTVQTLKGARTMGVDSTTRNLYLPTADLEPSKGQGRPRPKPGTFKIVVVSPSGKN